MAVVDIAAAHQKRQVSLSRRVAQAAGKLWATVDPLSIAGSWRMIVPALRTIVEAGQRTAAASSGAYLDDLLAEYRLPAGSQGRVRPSGFAGRASDGRDLDGLLYYPAIASLATIQRTRSTRRGLAAGRLALDVIVRTQIADAGRAADGVALTARPQLTGWVRMLTVPSCARCVLLAGRVYRWNDGFRRHPRCDCRHIPVAEDNADDLRTDPAAHFRSLSAEDQEKAFGAAGAQAIRDGADMSRVVNARDGMYVAGGKKLTYALASRGRRRLRPMPEQIYADANGDRDEALRLLRLHGYIGK